MPEGSKLMLLAPVVRDRKGEHLHVFEQMRAAGFIRVRVDGIVVDLDDVPELDKKRKHRIDVVIDRFKVREDLQLRLAESFETALELTDGVAAVAPMDGDGPETLFSARYACPSCGHSIDELEPRLFSFNNPAGACTSCDGLGVKQFFDEDRVVLHPEASLAEGAIRGWDRRNVYYFHLLRSLAAHYDFDMEKPFNELAQQHRDIILQGSSGEEIEFSYVNDRGTVFKRRHAFEGVIPNMDRRYRETESSSVRDELAKYVSTASCKACEGTRLCEDARSVYVDDRTLPSITALPVGDAQAYFDALELEGRQGAIAEKILKELRARYRFLVDVGLNYLTLNRSAETLSGGEAQRIRLASQIGAGLVGVMYILDEPSIGLHQRDNERLLSTLIHLRDLGNTVLVVEHDEDAIRNADHIIDIGPGAGVHGGEVVVSGTMQDVLAHPDSLTGAYLSGKKMIVVPEKRHTQNSKRQIKIEGARGNNLQNVSLSLPLGLLTCVTGVSGSGKSSLINGTLYPLAATALNGATTLKAAAHDQIDGLEQLDKCIDIDQSPLAGRRAPTQATYTGIFTPIRELFAGTQEARSRGYKPGRFSFNVRGGRCEACQGDGVTKVEMHFLPDIYVSCDVCKGKRYNRETLEIRFKDLNISEVLNLTYRGCVCVF
jgi:excinuclease ABC subunit A